MCIQILIGYPPEVIAYLGSSIDTCNVTIGTSTRILCNISSPHGHIQQVWWTFDNGTFQTDIYPVRNPQKYNGSTVDDPSLYIHDVHVTDNGTYRCHARSEFGVGISDAVAFLVQGLSYESYELTECNN